jgi:hypothetical protein
MSSPMRPGQITPNDFELAILKRLSEKEPCIGEGLSHLHVLSRKYTGVGSFTTFRCDDCADGPAQKDIGLGGLILMPGVSNGMGAVLFLKNGQPECLEIYTFGNEHWDGLYDGFSIPRTA